MQVEVRVFTMTIGVTPKKFRKRRIRTSRYAIASVRLSPLECFVCCISVAKNQACPMRRYSLKAARPDAS